jgi:hypothetical protein
MESFANRYLLLVKTAKSTASEAVCQQREVVQKAAAKVQELRGLDRTSPYTSIGSNAGQAEIAYNIEQARLNHEIEQLELIDQWADLYLEYIKRHTDTYNFNSFETFSDVCSAVNKQHLLRLISGYKFECKCQFFGNDLEMVNNHRGDHVFTDGELSCSWGTEVHLANIKSTINRIGLIGVEKPGQLNIYPIPNKYEG